MAKINLPPITGGFNLSTINANFDKVEEALNNDVLYRDNPIGEPNQMINDLDMNGKRIYNLPAPTLDHEPARRIDLEGAALSALKKTLRVSDTDLSTLPNSAARANKLLSFNSSGLPETTFPSEDNATALRIDLAANTGAGMVGFQPGGTGAVGRTLLDKAREVVSIFDVMTPLEISDAKSGAATYDLTTKLDQLSIDLKAAGGGVINIPPGTFALSKLTRRSGVSIIGSGHQSTYIKALTSANVGLVELENGSVIGSHLKGLHFIGGTESTPVNATQWGMYLHAQWDAGYNVGGLWMSDHEDLRFTHFKNGIWSRGGYTNAHYLRPNQFLKFNQVFVQVNTGGIPLRMTGQHGEVHFFGGSFDGRAGQTALRCIELDYDPSPSTTADNASGHGESTADVAGSGNAVLAPINVNFGGGLSIQKSQEAVFARLARAINFDGCWIEQIGKCFTVSTGAKIAAHGNHLANAASGALFGSPGNGYLVSLGVNASIDFGTDNNVAGTVDNITDPAVLLNNPLSPKFGAVETTTTNKFKAAAYKSFSLTATSIDLKGHKYATIAHGADKSVFLRTLAAFAAPGEVVYLRASGGPVTIAGGGNISIDGGLSELTVPNHAVIGFIRIPEVGGSGEWVVQSVSHQHRSVAEPADGYYYAEATKVWRQDASTSTSMGWVVVTPGLAGSTAVFKTMPALSA